MDQITLEKKPMEGNNPTAYLQQNNAFSSPSKTPPSLSKFPILFTSMENFPDSKNQDNITAGLPDSLIHTGTSGLRKRILQKGNSWRKPTPGDEVQVHFNVRLLEDSDWFDSSQDKGKPFSFILGQGEVIKGLDEGIATMKKGERSMFTIPPELAYGELGSPPSIPPNSTLIFDIEMVSWNTIRDITGDGGILKKILREGEGWATPKEADEVTVKYEAMLENGEVFSKFNDDGVEFSLLKGYLCPAMSKAVKTMRKGEKAELSVKFSYGLTESWKEENGISFDPVPKSNLIIHLELVAWKSVVDVMGDKKVLKKIISSGEPFSRPHEGSLVKVVYVGKLEDGTVFERKGSKEEPFQYICSEEQVNEGLDRAIMTMQKGEQAVVTLSSAESVLFYEVQLIDFSKEKPFWKMGTHEKITSCDKLKHDGNGLFKAGMFLEASKKYDKALKYIEYDHSFNDDEKSQASALRLSCNLNNAACKLKLGENNEASKLCTKVLELDKLNVKALYRRAQAYLRTSEFEKAEDDIKRALQIDPNNRDIKVEYKELIEKKKHYVKYEADIFSTMLSKMA